VTDVDGEEGDGGDLCRRECNSPLSMASRERRGMPSSSPVESDVGVVHALDTRREDDELLVMIFDAVDSFDYIAVNKDDLIESAISCEWDVD
jgi:hypothetical protein